MARINIVGRVEHLSQFVHLYKFSIYQFLPQFRVSSSSSFAELIILPFAVKHGLYTDITVEFVSFFGSLFHSFYLSIVVVFEEKTVEGDENEWNDDKYNHRGS